MSNPISRKISSRKSGGSPEHNEIIRYYKDCFKQKYSMIPEIRQGQVRAMLKDLLTRHSKKALMLVIGMYFNDTDRKEHHLGVILSSWSINTYLPKARLDPRVYTNAEEYNKDIF